MGRAASFEGGGVSPVRIHYQPLDCLIWRLPYLHLQVTRIHLSQAFHQLVAALHGKNHLSWNKGLAWYDCISWVSVAKKLRADREYFRLKSASKAWVKKKTGRATIEAHEKCCRNNSAIEKLWWVFFGIGTLMISHSNGPWFAELYIISWTSHSVSSWGFVNRHCPVPQVSVGPWRFQNELPKETCFLDLLGEPIVIDGKFSTTLWKAWPCLAQKFTKSKTPSN